MLSLSNKGPRLCWDILGGTSQGIYILFWRNRLVPMKPHSVPLLKKVLCAAFWEWRGWHNGEILLRGWQSGGEEHTHVQTLAHADPIAMFWQYNSTPDSNCLHRECTLLADRCLQLSFSVNRRPTLCLMALFSDILVCSCAIVSETVDSFWTGNEDHLKKYCRMMKETES